MLKIHTRRVGDVTVLCLQGQIVSGETSTLCDAVLLQSAASVVVLDLSRVSRVDAGGLGVLLELRGQTLSKNIDFRLMNVTKLVRKVFEITHLDSVFEISSAENGLALPGRPAGALELAPCA